ncbi:uncharacterized protein N7511_004123 [Penicillium nucicola]|uniref:uncharacterized protein n=1 Tax=Penicillium nucicola TaxID=1850975 RepID=UPI0025459DAB|nr:uncharacterized protein N7511_004123 [Penicillium nucicola]KAJ5766507.1 hypothetical protein N7511_004123 [Penicillium nucicola]
MTLFYPGSLQEGIALAVKDAKGVICFVRDDSELSTTWEDSHFTDGDIAEALNTKAVVLRLTAGSQEAGFLTSFCPVLKFPTVVLIKNGTLKEYMGPEVSKEDFRSRLLAALGDESAPSPVPQAQVNAAPTASASASSSPVTPVPQAQVPPTASPTRSTPKQSSEAAIKKRIMSTTLSKKHATPANSESNKVIKDTKDQANSPEKKDKGKAPASQKPTSKSVGENASTGEPPEPKPAVPRGPPTQYRLQVRLFDGSSVRSSFKPTQSIRNDVRPWLDQQMEGDSRPYNLKHILNPLPSETLSVTQESQTLQNLGIGSTANLVMVPVSTYTEAYSAAGSLPVRGISAVYNLASSAASTATGLVGSFLGYGAAAPANDTAPSTSSSPAPGSNPRTRNTGLNIRTLRDQQNEQGNSQLYNGNQLNFQPRNDQDGKDK